MKCRAFALEARVGVVASVLALALLWAGGEASACTTFLKAHEGSFLCGKSYDWNMGAGLVFVNKRNVEKNALIMDMSDKPAHWTSKYGSITFNQYGRELPQGGMNEAGLAMEIMMLGSTDYPPKDDRPAVNELQIIQYCLDLFANVPELVEGVEQIRVSKVYAGVHYLACDVTGACAAVEYIEGKLVVSTGEGMPVKTLTNDTYAESVVYLAQFTGFGGDQPIPQGTSSLDRFVRASALALQESDDPVPDVAFSILTAVAQGGFSKWNIVYDLLERRVYFRTHDNAKVKTVALADFDLECTSPVKLLDIDADLSGDVAADFQDYTKEANQALIEKTLGSIESIPDFVVTIVSVYPDGTHCTTPVEPPDNGPEPVADEAGSDIVVSPEPLAADEGHAPENAPDLQGSDVASDTDLPASGSKGGGGCAAAPTPSAFPGGALAALLATLALALLTGRARSGGGGRRGSMGRKVLCVKA